MVPRNSRYSDPGSVIYKEASPPHGGACLCFILPRKETAARSFLADSSRRCCACNMLCPHAPIGALDSWCACLWLTASNDLIHDLAVSREDNGYCYAVIRTARSTARSSQPPSGHGVRVRVNAQEGRGHQNDFLRKKKIVMVLMNNPLALQVLLRSTFFFFFCKNKNGIPTILG